MLKTSAHKCVLWTFVFALTSVRATAEEKAPPPKGATPSAPAKSTVETKHEAGAKDCHSYLASVEDGQSFATPDGKAFYYLSRLAGATNGKHTLLKASLNDGPHNLNALIQVKLKNRSILIPHGEPLLGFSLVSFKSEGTCNRGEGSALGVPLVTKAGGKPQIFKSFPQGSYQMVPTNKGRKIADLKSGYFRDIDIESNQRRQGPAFDAEETPLFLDESKGQFLSLSQDGSGVVNRYSIGKSTPSAQLKLSPEFKLITDGPLVAVVSFDTAGNTLAIDELAKWSGDTNRRYKIVLPPAFPVKNATLRIDFAHQLLLIRGNSATGRRWNKVFLYHYGTGTLLSEKACLDGQFIAHASFIPDGQHVIVAVHTAKDLLLELSALDIATKKWTRLTLPAAAP